MTRVEKPWGYELIWAKTDKYVGKILHINKGHQLSLQYHKLKEETIYVQSGKLQFLLEDDNGVHQTLILEPGQSAHTKPLRVHRMTALEDCDIFEVSTPELDDVVRLQDDYGRKD